MPWRTGFRLHGINLQLKINEKPDFRHHGVVQLEKLAKENPQANKGTFIRKLCSTAVRLNSLKTPKSYQKTLYKQKLSMLIYLSFNSNSIF